MGEQEVDMQSVFRIYPGHDGAFIEVTEDTEGMITVITTTPKSEEYFGKVNFRVEPRVAKKLAEAFKVLT